MMHRIGWTTALAVLALTVASAARAENKPVKLTKEWSGSVEDEKLMKDAPSCVTSAKALEKLWTAWKVEGKAPEIDFTKQIVVVGVTPGGKLKLSPVLSDKGDLQVLGLGTDDLVPGFRYVIGVVDREGVKTVNGKELPND